MQVRIRGAAIALATAALAGCAETGRSGFQARMASLVGLSETELLARMGPPAYDNTYRGRHTLGYQDQWTETYMEPWGGWREVVWFCEVVFTIEADHVAGFRSRGEGCGWQGRRNFPTA